MEEIIDVIHQILHNIRKTCVYLDLGSLKLVQSFLLLCFTFFESNNDICGNPYGNLRNVLTKNMEYKNFVFDSFLCSFKFQFYEVILGGLILLTCTAFQVLLSYIVTCNQFVVSKLIVLIWYVRMECITVLPLISAGPQINGAL